MSDKWCSECSTFHWGSAGCLPEWEYLTEGDFDETDPPPDLEGRTVRASDAEAAAERGAEYDCQSDPDCYKSYESGSSVWVRPRGGDAWRAFTVFMEAVPSFTAMPGRRER